MFLSMGTHAWWWDLRLHMSRQEIHGTGGKLPPPLCMILWKPSRFLITEYLIEYCKLGMLVSWLNSHGSGLIIRCGGAGWRGWEHSEREEWNKNREGSVNYKLALAMGTCHLLLRIKSRAAIADFNTHEKESRVENRKEALCAGEEKLAGQVFRYFQESTLWAQSYELSPPHI